MSDRDALVVELQATRQRFLALVADVRVELHRYCARMTGSIADGEDVVQDALARAYYALGELEGGAPLRPWLFRIAQNRAIDFVRRYEHRMREPLEVAEDTPAATDDPEDSLAREQALRAAVGRFVVLPPAQRSCVILKDVLGYSLVEIAALLELSVPAVKAALHRGRIRLREAPAPEATAAPSPIVERYARLFDARDWDGVRAMLADDVRLDLVSRSQRAGRHDVGTYFTNYAATPDWHAAIAWLDGRQVIALFGARGAPRASYIIRLAVRDDRIATIQDFRYVPYILDEARLELA